VQVISGHGGWVYSVSFSHDASRIASSSLDETIRIWDVVTGNELRKLTGHSGWIYGCIHSPDSKTVASCADDQTIRVWDLNTGAEIRKFAKHWGPVSSVCYSPHGDKLASVSSDKTLRLWDVQYGKELGMIEAGTGWLYSCDFSPCGKAVACTSEDKVSRIYSVSSRQELARMHGHTASVACGRFDPSGKYYATCSEDKTVRLYDLTCALHSSKTRLTPAHVSAIAHVAYSDDGMFAVSGSRDGDVLIWAVGAGQLMDMRRIPTRKEITRVCFSNTSTMICAVTADHMVVVYEAATGVLVQDMQHSHPIVACRFGGGGKHVVSVTSDGTVHTWGLTGTELSSFVCDAAVGTNCVLSSDASVLACVLPTEAVLVSVTGHHRPGTVVSRLTGFGSVSHSVSAISETGKIILVGEKEGRLFLFDTLTHTLTHSFVSSPGLTCVSITAGAAYVVAGHSSGVEVATLAGARGCFTTPAAVTSLATDPADANRLCVGLQSGHVLFLELRSLQHQ